MAFWSNYFNQAGEIVRPSRDLEFEQRKNGELVSLLEREEWKNKELTKEVTRSRNSEMRTLRHHADVVSKQAKTQSSFSIIAKEDEPKLPPPKDPDLEEKIRWAAEQSRQIDIDEGTDPLPLEEYERMVRDNPDRHIFH